MRGEIEMNIRTVCGGGAEVWVGSVRARLGVAEEELGPGLGAKLDDGWVGSWGQVVRGGLESRSQVGGSQSWVGGQGGQGSDLQVQCRIKQH